MLQYNAVPSYSKEYLFSSKEYLIPPGTIAVLFPAVFVYSVPSKVIRAWFPGPSPPEGPVISAPAIPVGNPASPRFPMYIYPRNDPPVNKVSPNTLHPAIVLAAPPMP